MSVPVACYVTKDAKPNFRPCAGIMLLNADGEIFVGQRLDSKQSGWQMPQGGIDDGENAVAAVWREMREEIGTDNADLLQESGVWRSYDLPNDLATRLWSGRYRGQTQRWFAFRFKGLDQEIVIDGVDPEFAKWQWLPAEQLLDNIVNFKRDVYASVVDEFRHLWA